MRPVDIIEGKVSVLDRADVDTDQIIPKQFLKRVERTGFGEFLFYDWIRDGEIELEPNPVLVTGANFGSGSSREHAPWALQDFGIRCVIASSFADIFHNNCYKNGLLPVVLRDDEVTAIRAQVHANPGAQMSVDLFARTVTDPQGGVHHFEIDPVRRKCLLEGLDDIARTHQYAERRAMFEDLYRTERPWLFDSGEQR